MQILQLLPTLAYGDAVGNDVLAVNNIIKELGYTTAIYAENIDSRVKCPNLYHYSNLPAINDEDIIIYHFSTGSVVMENILMNQQCRKIMIYHNITPALFFMPYNDQATNLVDSGRESLKKLVNTFDCCFADSFFNVQDLLDVGYTCPIDVLPILIPFEDYKTQPDSKIIRKYSSDGWVNMLFVGRVSPNKRHEDIIKAFAYYKRHINNKSRLFLVGNYQGMEKYYDRLQRYIQLLGITDVIFTGHTSFKEILAYYSIAHVFICMSEHEGFCVPLIEAMQFDIPIIAYDSCAVPETLGGAGIIVDNKNSGIIAKFIDKIVTDFQFYNKLVHCQQTRLLDFSYQNIASLTKNKIIQFIDNDYSSPTSSKNIEIQFVGNIDWREEIKDTVALFEIELKRDGVYDRTPSFNMVPIENDSGDKSNHGLKYVLKYKILKPTYLRIAAFSPRTANLIRNAMYSIIPTHGNLLNDGLIIERQNRSDSYCIFVDVTQISLDNPGSGIQRVVSNVLKNLIELDPRIIPVRIWRNKLITCFQFLDELLDIPYDGKEQEIQFQRGDILFLLDSSWNFHHQFSKVCDLAHKREVLILSMIHDLFPVQYPELFESLHFKQVFESWHLMLLEKSDVVLCNSNTTADVVRNYNKFKRIKRDEPLTIDYFHMGSDIPSVENYARDEIKTFVALSPTFLMVGTVEPRKGYGCVLEAFSCTNKDIKLLIIGKNGWDNDEFSKKIAFDRELSKKVLWIKDASDEELRWSYQHATALIAASKDEGFGLPLIEAAHFNLPIICSNIPVFHEVTNDNALYFTPMDVHSLLAILNDWLVSDSHPDSSKIKLYSWRDSAQEILQKMGEIRQIMIRPEQQVGDQK